LRSFVLVLVLALTTLSQTSPAQAQDPACSPQAIEVRDATIGGSLVLGAYATSGFLGALADEFNHGNLPAIRVRAQAAGQSGAISAQLQQLDALLGSGTLNPADVTVLQRLRDLFVTLKAEADALVAYASSRDKAQAAAFRENRKKAWEELVKLMGFEPAVAEVAAPGGAMLGMPEGH